MKLWRVGAANGRSIAGLLGKLCRKIIVKLAIAVKVFGKIDSKLVYNHNHPQAQHNWGVNCHAETQPQILVAGLECNFDGLDAVTVVAKIAPSTGDRVRLYQPIAYSSGRSFSRQYPTASFIGGSSPKLLPIISHDR